MDLRNSDMEICLVKSVNNNNFACLNSELGDNRKQLPFSFMPFKKKIILIVGFPVRQ